MNRSRLLNWGARCGWLVCALWLAGCATAERGSWVRQEAYFGDVAADDWRQFVEEVVGPTFPDGFTVLEGYGEWRDATGKVHRQRSRILVVFAEEAETGRAGLTDVAAEFKKRFRQQSVLTTESDATVEFY